MFTEIKNISKMRVDGRLDELLRRVPDGQDNADRITAASLDDAVIALKERSLAVVIPKALAGDGYFGVGDQGGYYGSPGSKPLFPHRHVHLFMREKQGEGPWLEVCGYHKNRARPAIDAALATVRSFAELPAGHAALSGLTPPWGAVLSHLEEQNSRYVPIQHVPDRYNPAPGGRSGLGGDASLALLTDDDKVRVEDQERRDEVRACLDQIRKDIEKDAKKRGEKPATTRRKGYARWDKTKDDPVLVARCDGKPAPNKHEIERISGAMNKSSGQVNTALGRLRKACKIRH